MLKIKRLARFLGSILLSQSDLIFIVFVTKGAVCFALNCKYFNGILQILAQGIVRFTDGKLR